MTLNFGENTFAVNTPGHQRVQGGKVQVRQDYEINDEKKGKKAQSPRQTDFVATQTPLHQTTKLETSAVCEPIAQPPLRWTNLQREGSPTLSQRRNGAQGKQTEEGGEATFMEMSLLQESHERQRPGMPTMLGILDSSVRCQLPAPATWHHPGSQNRHRLERRTLVLAPSETEATIKEPVAQGQAKENQGINGYGKYFTIRDHYGITVLCPGIKKPPWEVKEQRPKNSETAVSMINAEWLEEIRQSYPDPAQMPERVKKLVMKHEASSSKTIAERMTATSGTLETMENKLKSLKFSKVQHRKAWLKNLKEILETWQTNVKKYQEQQEEFSALISAAATEIEETRAAWEALSKQAGESIPKAEVVDITTDDANADGEIQETTKQVMSLMKTCLAVGNAGNEPTQIDSDSEVETRPGPKRGRGQGEDGGNGGNGGKDGAS